jgi:hypothetical protein
MNEDQEIRTKENDEIVLRNCELIWEALMKDTDTFTDARRFIIFSSVTAYMVANVYLHAVELSADAMSINESLNAK